MLDDAVELPTNLGKVSGAPMLESIPVVDGDRSLRAFAGKPRVELELVVVGAVAFDGAWGEG